MNLPPLHKLDARVCPPCTPTTPTDVSVHQLLLLAEERDRLKAESELALQLQRASLQGGEADAEPPALPDADSSIECVICFGSLLKGSSDEPYPPQSLQGGVYGRPYVTVCANGHLVHKECIKRHLANDNRTIGRRCPECREDVFRRLDLTLYPKEEQGRVQRDLWKYAEKGEPEVVGYLLAVGASPNLFALGGWNALMLAAMANHLNVVKVLLADPRTNVWVRGGSRKQTAFDLAVTRRGLDDPVAKLIGDVMGTLDEPEAERAAEAAAPAPEPAQPPEQPPVIPPQTAADRARGVRWDGQGTHPLVMSTWRNWWMTDGPGMLNASGLDEDATLHTRMGLEMARTLLRTKVENFRRVYDLLYDIAWLEFGDAVFLGDFAIAIYAELEEAIYNELRYGVEFRVAVTAARESDPAWRGPIFDWLMQGGLERVVDGFHETELQGGRGETAAARYVWVLNLRASAEELAQRDAAGVVDDFDHSLDKEYLAPNHNSWVLAPPPEWSPPPWPPWEPPEWPPPAPLPLDDAPWPSDDADGAGQAVEDEDDGEGGS